MSACVYAFFGGVKRVVPPVSKLGIHRMAIYEHGRDPAGGDMVTRSYGTDDIVTAIVYDKDQILNTLCSPMRANEAMTLADATAIADYLKSLAPVANAVNACPARM